MAMSLSVWMFVLLTNDVVNGLANNNDNNKNNIHKTQRKKTACSSCFACQDEKTSQAIFFCSSAFFSQSLDWLLGRLDRVW